MGFFFLVLSIFSSMLIFFCESFFMIWFFIELNIIRFICFICLNQNNLKGEAFQYLLSQRIPSLIFLFFIINYLKLNFIFINYFLILVIIMKLGAVPFQFWYFNILEKFSWDNIFILSTFQKIIPLISLYMFVNFVSFFIYFNILVSILGALSRKNLKFMIAYSSIFMLRWLFSLIKNLEIIFFFFIFYSISIFVVIKIFLINRVNRFSEILKLKFSSSNVLALVFGFIRIAGIPPFLGFLRKLISVIFLNNFFITLRVVLVTCSCFLTYLYCRIIFLTWGGYRASIFFLMNNESLPIFLILISPVFFLF